MISTSSLKFFDGIPVLIPNKIISDQPHHYISYNTTDFRIYGNDTTAIVLKRYRHHENLHQYTGDVFLVLNGKHDKLIGLNLLECLEYFSINEDKKNGYSEGLNDYLIYRPF